MRAGSQDELVASRDEVMRLGGLLERAMTALQHAGAEKSADPLERELDVPVETLREAAADNSATLYPGQVKTDARDAFVIADAARSLPHTVRQVDVGDEALAELDVLVGFDDDLAGEATRIGNRIRGLITGIHPALERAIGPKITHLAVLEILSRCGGPTVIRKAGRRKPASIELALGAGVRGTQVPLRSGYAQSASLLFDWSR